MSTLAIVGAGPNLGLAAASRFGAEGFDVGLVARNTQRLEELRGTLGQRGIRAAAAAADIRRPQAVAQALEDLIERLGLVDVLLYSPSVVVEWIKPEAESTAADVRPHLELSVLGVIDAVQTVLPGMRERGGGTLLFTTGGAAVAPSADRASSAISYAAEVAYARMLHESLAGEGIHVAHTAIVEPLGPGRQHEPAHVAELLWRQHAERGDFQTVLGQ
jgi:NADP-dependent 3-hydroxy acid dehydrogenase YdfG